MTTGRESQRVRRTAHEAAVSAWCANPDEGLGDGPYSRSSLVSEFVPVIFARNIEEAQCVQIALEQLGIPTLVECGAYDRLSLDLVPRRVPVLVPEDMQDQASEIVARIERRLVNGFDEDEMDDDFMEEEDFDEDDEEYDDGDDEEFDEDDDF